MASTMKVLGLLLFLALSVGEVRPYSMVNTLDDLANIQRDLLFKTFDYFNASVTDQMERLIDQLRSLDARLKEVEDRLADSPAQTNINNEAPIIIQSEPEEEPTMPPRKPTTRRTTTQPPTTTTMPPTTTPTTTNAPTTTPTTTMPTTTPMPTASTCAELATRGTMTSGTYMIDPMMTGEAFSVECEFPAGITVINHNLVGQAVENNGKEAPAAFSLDPVYPVSFQQLKALTARSQNCSQFIRYDCRAAVLLAEDKKTRTRYGYWVSVDGEPIVSWGGTPINSKKCACAYTSEGCLGGKNCNCDSNPKTWNFDEGLLADKPYLPVSNVFLGDTGSKKEMGKLTLGPLRCQG
ncbi:contactin-associated protein-like 2 isoform X2 [Diadema setosum]|uniref:contactin-associated protein-like 2 isoform X2 n=1 Tax=Diadema setosum TaxID=31175 RepID=UPI003B3BAAB1